MPGRKKGRKPKDTSRSVIKTTAAAFQQTMRYAAEAKERSAGSSRAAAATIKAYCARAGFMPEAFRFALKVAAIEDPLKRDEFVRQHFMAVELSGAIRQGDLFDDAQTKIKEMVDVAWTDAAPKTTAGLPMDEAVARFEATKHLAPQPNGHAPEEAKGEEPPAEEETDTAAKDSVTAWRKEERRKKREAAKAAREAAADDTGLPTAAEAMDALVH